MSISPATPAPASLQQWIGRRERVTDRITAAPLVGLSATLDRDDPEPHPGSELPPLAHWLYFLPRAPQRELAGDGHPHRGGFLPPVTLPRRMWAGGRLDFRAPLHVDDEVQRTSTIADVREKHSRSGALVFVTVRHEIVGARGMAITEEQDIVYRAPPAPGGPQAVSQPAATDEQFSRQVTPDPVLLFRYSALTFNGHRIHYDRNHATAVEGYPGLVVHGPLVATLLLDLLRRQRPALAVRSFRFRAVGPLFDIHRFELCGREEAGGYRLWARDHQGGLAMDASADVNPGG